MSLLSNFLQQKIRLQIHNCLCPYLLLSLCLRLLLSSTGFSLKRLTHYSTVMSVNNANSTLDLKVNWRSLVSCKSITDCANSDMRKSSRKQCGVWVGNLQQSVPIQSNLSIKIDRNSLTRTRSITTVNLVAF